MSAPSDFDSSDNEGQDDKIEVFHLINRLRQKLGVEYQDSNKTSEIDPESIKQADAIIDKLCENCAENMAEQLEKISSIWDSMKDMPRSDDRDVLGSQIFTLAHEVKDIGQMCGYELAAFFAETLRDYIVKTELKLDAQRIIIQAHIDALNVVIKQDLKDEQSAGEAAKELKQMVKVAIDKYS